MTIYIHYPWCIKKCPYCDFNSYGLDQFTEKEDDYVKALISEIRLQVKALELENTSLKSIFFGGGTPSLMKSDSVDLILETIRKELGGLPENCEITLEANPGSINEPVDKERLKDYKSVGINRISCGIQSFNPEKLSFLGRIHSTVDSRRAIENIMEAGFENFNLDLIFGCKDETLSDWIADLTTALTFHPPHLSAYSLTIEPGTVFGRMSKSGKILTGEDSVVREMSKSLFQLTKEAKLERYEISNFSKPDRKSIHNSNYWSGESYLGVGAGAHSFQPSPNYGIRWWNIPGPDAYMKSLNSGKLAIHQKEKLNKEQARIEFFFLKLRTSSGFSKKEYHDSFGSEGFEQIESLANNLVENGSLLKSHSTIPSNPSFQLSPEGFLVADSIIEEFSNRC